MMSRARIDTPSAPPVGQPAFSIAIERRLRAGERPDLRRSAWTSFVDLFSPTYLTCRRRPLGHELCRILAAPIPSHVVETGKICRGRTVSGVDVSAAIPAWLHRADIALQRTCGVDARTHARSGGDALRPRVTCGTGLIVSRAKVSRIYSALLDEACRRSASIGYARLASRSGRSRGEIQSAFFRLIASARRSDRPLSMKRPNIRPSRSFVTPTSDVTMPLRVEGSVLIRRRI